MANFGCTSVVSLTLATPRKLRHYDTNMRCVFIIESFSIARTVSAHAQVAPKAPMAPGAGKLRTHLPRRSYGAHAQLRSAVRASGGCTHYAKCLWCLLGNDTKRQPSRFFDRSGIECANGTCILICKMARFYYGRDLWATKRFRLPSFISHVSLTTYLSSFIVPVAEFVMHPVLLPKTSLSLTGIWSCTDCLVTCG